MKYITLAIVFSTFIITSCNSTKNTTSEDTKQISSDMLKEGFVEGVIVYSDAEGDCAYTIKTKGEVTEFLDPINLKEEYKADGQSIWFKFTGLRQKNRCDKARPVTINEIVLKKN